MCAIQIAALPAATPLSFSQCLFHINRIHMHVACANKGHLLNCNANYESYVVRQSCHGGKSRKTRKKNKGLLTFWRSSGNVVAWFVEALCYKAGRSRVRFPMRSLDFSIDLILIAICEPTV
jgi:hypothetical protein